MDYSDLGMDPEILRLKAASEKTQGTTNGIGLSANGHGLASKVSTPLAGGPHTIVESADNHVNVASKLIGELAA